jgi:hypothetical protein
MYHTLCWCMAWGRHPTHPTLRVVLDVFLTSTMNVRCWTLPSISFLFNLPEWVRETFSDSPILNKLMPSSGELFPWQRNFSSDFIRNEGKSECLHCWMLWTFLTLNITLIFLFPDFSVIYFLADRTCVRKRLHNFLSTLYMCVYFCNCH